MVTIPARHDCFTPSYLFSLSVDMTLTPLSGSITGPAPLFARVGGTLRGANPRRKVSTAPLQVGCKEGSDSVPSDI